MVWQSGAVIEQADVPKTIGSYRCLYEAGRGGTGVVYAAERTTDFAQRVAIKVLHRVFAAGQQSSLLRSLDHPGIVKLLDRGTLPDGRAYLVMEWIDGEPIDAFCKAQRLPLRARAAMLVKVAEAVGYAHARLITHADLKPGNLLVSTGLEPKLLDFGVAEVLQAASAEVQHFSPGFSSPEQQFGGTSTVLADVYAFGKTAEAVLRPGTAKLPPELEAVLRKSCAAEPEERYSSMRTLAEDLQAWLDRRPVKAYGSGGLYSLRSWAERNKLTAGLTAVLLLSLLVSVAAVSVQTVRAERQRRASEARLRELVSLTGVLQGQLYRSLPPGAASDASRAALMTQVHTTLERVAAQSGNDARVNELLAEQYDSLRPLDAATGDTGAAAADEAMSKRLRSSR